MKPRLLAGQHQLNIRYFRSTETAKLLLDETNLAAVVTEQCDSLDSSRHQFYWAHVTRNLTQIADYSCGGLTSLIGKRLMLLCYAVFRTQHHYRNGDVDEARRQNRIAQLRKRMTVRLKKGEQMHIRRYVGKCSYILKHKGELWIFLKPLANNETER
ncbi:transposase [Plesiomonas shigelloides]|uniref:transposase n=1 Tax=Plesiomonas shigelloides TaxID=703 RepID=UPI0012621707|nr:transposase [Plesiomonas shigelloides]KAB7664456.1 transposase [Plesiomonas shigelloides]